MPTPKPWLWPDHVIGKRESRRLREEHNAAVNILDPMREALKEAEWHLRSAWESFSAICETDGSTDRIKARDRSAEGLKKVRAALALAEDK